MSNMIWKWREGLKQTVYFVVVVCLNHKSPVSWIQVVFSLLILKTVTKHLLATLGLLAKWFSNCVPQLQVSLEDPPWESPRGKAIVSLKRRLAVSSSPISSLPSLCLRFNQNNSAFICFMYWPSHLVSFRKAALQLTILKSRLSEWQLLESNTKSPPPSRFTLRLMTWRVSPEGVRARIQGSTFHFPKSCQLSGLKKEQNHCENRTYQKKNKVWQHHQ